MNFKDNPNSMDDHEFMWFYSLRIFSLKLSGDNKEIIAGCGRRETGAPVQVYDINASKVKYSIKGAQANNDINTIDYVDKKQSSIFITGSDDGTCKLWDTRIINNNKPVGIFYGHMCGLTCVSSKEDNRYFISNSKDQSLKLWDLRKTSTESKRYPIFSYDYRYQEITPESIDQLQKHAKAHKDQSVMTFYGHKVHGTLIRCHFSPKYSTGQRYIYSGSYDGKIYIYDTISGELVSCLEPPRAEDEFDHPTMRDCSWHPFSQNIITTNFAGAIHRWEHMCTKDAQKITK
eukprot:CAMPEP_0114587800 /NCGR_PEP_ID=MMETSP0125-20121206/10668_1 /TAXON_ID=485358 ORGANISM="Aristerostoma sp., Strain ATCC 50986" /NCGR_SAMPLE_ID=MMETSP0125 /ASSEMBLY_ACC=CAM_ASM_000245 /LENGTH=288 /DNA_ID=CAMNT_0001783889 /DNA_START=566 /DNA_END=1433 /DNA_ORIENTATION=+